MAWQAIAGGAAGGAVGGLIGLGGQALQHSYAKKQAKYSYKLARRYRQSAYQDTVADMRAAGINPILAAGGGPTNAGGFAAGGAPAQLGQVIEGVRTGALMSEELKQAKLTTEQLRHAVATEGARGALLEDQALEARSRRALADINTALLRTGMARAKAQEQFDREHPWLNQVGRGLQALGISAREIMPRTGARR